MPPPVWAQVLIFFVLVGLMWWGFTIYDHYRDGEEFEEYLKKQRGDIPDSWEWEDG